MKAPWPRAFSVSVRQLHLALGYWHSGDQAAHLILHPLPPQHQMTTPEVFSWKSMDFSERWLT